MVGGILSENFKVAKASVRELKGEERLTRMGTGPGVSHEAPQGWTDTAGLYICSLSHQWGTS